MKPYPTAAEQPNRKVRKSQRRKIFAENQDAIKVAREARRAARKADEAK
jgi:hypothetical protein